MARLRDLDLGRRGSFPARWMSVRTSRSSGPGGQHVNKVESKVDLRLDLAQAAQLLGDAAIERVRRVLANRLDAEGNLQVVSSEHRDQARNLAAALDRAEALLRAALAPAKRRRPTRPTRGSQLERLQEKRARGRIKRSRRDRGEQG